MNAVSLVPKEMRDDIAKMESQWKLVLPPHIPPDKFARVILTSLQTNAELLKADRQSLFAACSKCAQDGLLPDGREAALVTFSTKKGILAQYMPMIAGILKKVRQSGELVSINAQVVYEKDDFDYWTDESGEHLKHRPLLQDDRGKRRLAYAVARVKDGGIYVEVMTAKQVLDVRNVSRAAHNGPWSGPFEDEMWRKTALRRLAKRLPMSTDLEQVIRRDDELFDWKTEALKASSETAERARALTEAIVSGKTDGTPDENAPPVKELAPAGTAPAAPAAGAPSVLSADEKLPFEQ